MRLLYLAVATAIELLTIVECRVEDGSVATYLQAYAHPADAK